MWFDTLIRHEPTSQQILFEQYINCFYNWLLQFAYTCRPITVPLHRLCVVCRDGVHEFSNLSINTHQQCMNNKNTEMLKWRARKQELSACVLVCVAFAGCVWTRSFKTTRTARGCFQWHTHTHTHTPVWFLVTNPRSHSEKSCSQDKVSMYVKMVHQFWSCDLWCHLMVLREVSAWTTHQLTRLLPQVKKYSKRKQLHWEVSGGGGWKVCF